MGLTPGCASDKLVFDHCYQKIVDENDFARMESLGFTFFPITAEHPYSLLSRIILIGSPPAEASARIPYLELCLIRDPEGELAHARATKPDADERDLYRPGFSLRSTAPLEDCLKDNAEQWETRKPSLTHRNYDWKDGEAERRPGWNFLDFENPPLPGVHLWLTEYEARPEFASDPKVLERKRAGCVHANGVTGFAGFVFSLSEAEQRSLSQLVGAKWHNGSLPFDGGIMIHSHNAHPEYGALLADKVSPFKAVILSCASLSRFSDVSGIRPLADRPMIRIASAQPESWDILVIESGEPVAPVSGQKDASA
jgi:hypothetical protein